MDFRILGPLEVYAGDALVPVDAAKPRALLAILLLHANEVVSSDRLTEALWGAEPPDTAAKALQVHISRLRRTIGATAISTRPPGYVLEVEDGRLDLHRFQQLHEAAARVLATDPAEARRLLGEALALWRGPPLADFAYEPFAQAEIARLEGLRMAAVEDRVEADLAVGRHAEVIGELETLTGEYPLRERLRGQLMLALYRSGRQVEALEVFRAARAALSEELGIEPGRELRHLHQAILRQEHELDLDLPPTAEAEPGRQSRGVFVGRERELGELTTMLDDALAGHGRLVLLAGEPGIGKSLLADELMGRARARGALVLVGRCWEAGGAPAYWPWVQALRTLVRETEPDAVLERLGAGAANLAQLLPELRELFPGIPALPALEPDGARIQLFDAMSSFLERAAQARPLVVVLDDVHAADEPSLLFLRFIAREVADSRMLVLGAFRDVDPTVSAPLGSTLAELVREPHARQIELGGLSAEDLAEYIHGTTGIEPPEPLVAAIHRETEGNPLFVVETVRLLDAESRLHDAEAALRIPPGVRAVIGQRVARLSERCRKPLLLAAVIGREFGLDALAQCSALPSDELLDILDEAMAERVVGEVPGSPGRLRFGHALIRDALYDELTPARRLQLHRAVGEGLEVVYAGDIEPHLAELARQFSAAAPAGVAGKAVDYARRAAERAASQLAYEEAVRLYELALSLARDPETRCGLLLARGDAQARAGDTPASKWSFRDAAELADRLGLTDYFARAALGYGGRLLWDVSRGDSYLVPLLERALDRLSQADSPRRVRLLARLGGGPLRDLRFPPERKRAAVEEALEMARRIGDPATLAYAISGYNAANHSPDFTPRQVGLATELIEVAGEAGDLERAAEGHEHRCAARIELGDLPGAKADLAAMADFARRLGQPSQDWFVTVYMTLILLLEARFDEAARLMSEARRLGERAESWNAAVTYRLQLYGLRREQGRLIEVAELVRRSTDEYPTYPILRCVAAHVASELGEDAEARELLDDLTRDGFAALTFDEEWLVSMGLLTEAALAIGDLDRLPDLYDRLRPYAGRVALSYPEISTGSVARLLGRAAGALECWEDSEAHFELALETNARIGARGWLAHTQRDYAAMLRMRPGDRDDEKAERLLAEALDAYRRLGMDAHATAVAGA